MSLPKFEYFFLCFFKVIHVKKLSDSYKMGSLENRVNKFLEGIKEEDLIKVSACDCCDCGPVVFITYKD